MKAKVIKPFQDKENEKNIYAVGDEFEGTTKRVMELRRLGFVKPATGAGKTAKDKQ